MVKFKTVTNLSLVSRQWAENEPGLKSTSPAALLRCSDLPTITELPPSILALRERMLALALNGEVLRAGPDAPWSWPAIHGNGKSQRIPSLLKRVFWHIAVRL